MQIQLYWFHLVGLTAIYIVESTKCGVSEITIQTTGHESFVPKFSLKCYARVSTYNFFALVLHTYQVLLFISIMPNDDGRKEQHIQNSSTSMITQFVRVFRISMYGHEQAASIVKEGCLTESGSIDLSIDRGEVPLTWDTSQAQLHSTVDQFPESIATILAIQYTNTLAYINLFSC